MSNVRRAMGNAYCSYTVHRAMGNAYCSYTVRMHHVNIMPCILLWSGVTRIHVHRTVCNVYTIHTVQVTCLCALTSVRLAYTYITGNYCVLNLPSLRSLRSSITKITKIILTRAHDQPCRFQCSSVFISC